MTTTLRAVTDFDPQTNAASLLPKAVRQILLERGVSLETRAEESPSSFGDRLDTALMALFRDTRNADYFEALYARSGAAVLDWLRRLLAQQRCRLDPLEVLQDTFVNVYQYSTRFRDERPESFRVWVRTIASNALCRARSQMSRRTAEPVYGKGHEAVALRAEPARRLDEEEERGRLALTWMVFLDHYSRAYSGLLARDQLALALVEVEAMSYAEAGARLRVGASNMKMIMFRARRRLIARMEDSMGLDHSEDQTRNPSLRHVG